MFVGNLTETISLGQKFSDQLHPRSIVLLEGPIGAGKTSFVQGIAKGLSITENITSPTFALSHHYISGKIPLIHLDLYRLENKDSAKDFFYEEEEEAHQSKAILVIEWPKFIEPIIDNFWKITIKYAKGKGRNYDFCEPINSLTSDKFG